VVCNGDESELELRLQRDPRVDLLLRPGVNLGVASGWNEGARIARGRFLIFVNEDSVLGRDTLARMVRILASERDTLVGVEGEYWCRRCLRPARRPHVTHNPERSKVLVPAGYLFGIERHFWQEVGGFDDELSPAFYEEIDLAFRVNERGGRTVLLKGDSTEHEWGVSAASRKKEVSWAGGRTTLGGIHRRNERRLLRTWSTDGWRSWTLLHPTIYWSKRAVLHAGRRTLRNSIRRVERVSGKEVPYGRRLVAGALSGAWTTLWARLVGFLVVPMLVSILGLNLYGVWAIASLLIGSQGLLDLGMSAGSAKFVAEAQERGDGPEVRRILKISIVGYSILSAVFALVLVPLVPHLPRWLRLPPAEFADARLLFVGAVFLYALSNYVVALKAVLQGLQRLTAANVSVAAAQIPYVLLILLAWSLDWGPLGALLGLTALYGTQGMLMLLFVMYRLPGGGSPTKPTTLRTLFSFGARVQLITVVDFLVLHAPKAVGGFLLGASAAGQLDLAMRLPLVASGLVLPLLPPLLPAASRLAARGSSAMLEGLFERSLRYLAAVAFLVFGVLFVAGPSFLHWWVGPAASGLDAPLRYFAIGLLAQTLAGGATSIAIGAGQPGLVARYEALLLLSTVILLVAVRGDFGIEGIAAVTGVALPPAAGYMLKLMKGLIGLSAIRRAVRSIWRPLANGLAATAVGGLVLVVARLSDLPLEGLLAGAVTTAVYVVLLPVTGSIRVEDVQLALGKRVATAYGRISARLTLGKQAPGSAPKSFSERPTTDATDEDPRRSSP